MRAQLETGLQLLAPYELNVRFDTPSQGSELAAREGNHRLIVMGSGRHTELGWHGDLRRTTC